MINYMYNTISNNFENVILLPLDENQTNQIHRIYLSRDADIRSFKQKYKTEYT